MSFYTVKRQIESARTYGIYENDRTLVEGGFSSREAAEQYRDAEYPETDDTPAPVTDYQVVQAMLKFGGSFAKAIGEAFTRADSDHYARLRAAFPEMWAEYTDLARLSVKQENR